MALHEGIREVLGLDRLRHTGCRLADLRLRTSRAARPIRGQRLLLLLQRACVVRGGGAWGLVPQQQPWSAHGLSPSPAQVAEAEDALLECTVGTAPTRALPERDDHAGQLGWHPRGDVGRSRDLATAVRRRLVASVTDIHG